MIDNSFQDGINVNRNISVLSYYFLSFHLLNTGICFLTEHFFRQINLSLLYVMIVQMLWILCFYRIPKIIFKCISYGYVSGNVIVIKLGF